MKLFRFQKHVDEIEAGLQELVAVPKPEIQESETDALLRMVYAAGEDGWPVSDLVFYISKEANPEVKKFILDNIMIDVSAAKTPSVNGLPDNQVIMLMRQDGESRESYLSRLSKSVSDDITILQRAKQSVPPSQLAEPAAE